MELERRAERSAAVFLLEPHTDERQRYAQALRREGYEVISFAESDEALASATDRPPRIIVASFDSHTREDRFVLCLRLKAHPHLRSVPVLLTSPNIDDVDLHRATDLKL